MNQHYENILSMYGAVTEICNQYSTVWSGNVAFSTNLSNFNSKVAEINTLKLQQETVITGIAQDKKVKRLAVTDSAMVIIGATVAYAVASSDNKLRDEVRYTRSTLNSLRDTDFITAVRIVHTKATENVAHLNEYGIEPPMLDDFNTLITEYEALSQDPRAAIADRKAATQNFKPLFDSANGILEILDALVEVFKPASPAFYNAYKASRIIVDLGIRHEPTPEPPPEPPSP
jgi:hypothetical protein